MQITHSQWWTALGVFTVVAAGLWLGQRLITGLTKRAGLRLSNRWFAFIEEQAASLKVWVVLIAAFWAASLFLPLPNQLHELIQFLLVMALAIQIGIWAGKAIDFYFQSRLNSDPAADVSRWGTYDTIRIFFKFLLWIFVVLFIIDNIPGVDLTGLITGLGVTGIAISLAIQSITGDLLSSLAIALDKPFVVGDFISDGKFSGTIESIGLRSTRVRGLNGEQLIFSNSDLIKNPIQNFRDIQQRRRVLDVRADYATSPDLAARIPSLLRQAVESARNTIFQRAFLKRFDPTSLIYELSYFVNSGDLETATQADNQVNLAIVEKFKELNILPAALQADQSEAGDPAS